MEALSILLGDQFRHPHGATGTQTPPSRRVSVAKTAKRAESTNAATALPIQLAEYFRPSNGLPRPFSLSVAHFLILQLFMFQTQTGSTGHLAFPDKLGRHRALVSSK